MYLAISYSVSPIDKIAAFLVLEVEVGVGLDVDNSARPKQASREFRSNFLLRAEWFDLF